MDERNAAPVALVTGAARRVGAAIVRRLHQDGWTVAIHCRSACDDADALCAALNQQRRQSAAVFVADLGHRDAPEQLATAVTSALGAPQALVNNASSYFPTAFGSIGVADIDALLVSNFTAPLLLTQACATAGGLRAVVNLLDIHARQQPRAGFSAYTAAKAALWSLTESLAVELAPAVRVNGVAPGHILAEVGDPPSAAEQLDLVDKAAQLGRVPLARFGTSSEVAAAVAWLLSDQASFISGVILPVDGARRLG